MASSVAAFWRQLTITAIAILVVLSESSQARQMVLRELQADMDVQGPLPEIYAQRSAAELSKSSLDEDYTYSQTGKLRHSGNVFSKNDDLEVKRGKEIQHGLGLLNMGAARWKNPAKMDVVHIKPAGGSARLSCDAEGNPTPNITWNKNGASPITRNLGHISYSRWSLNLDELTKTDDGNYTCVVCNGLGCIQHTFHLEVMERLYTKPILEEGPKNITVFIGDNASFKCEFMSDQHPYVYWLFRKSLSYDNLDGPRVSSDNSEDKPEQLTIYNVTKEDEGWYLCVAINSLGYTTARYLNVIQRSLTEESRKQSVDAPVAAARSAFEPSRSGVNETEHLGGQEQVSVEENYSEDYKNKSIFLLSLQIEGQKFKNEEQKLRRDIAVIEKNKLIEKYNLQIEILRCKLNSCAKN